LDAVAEKVAPDPDEQAERAIELPNLARERGERQTERQHGDADLDDQTRPLPVDHPADERADERGAEESE